MATTKTRKSRTHSHGRQTKVSQGGRMKSIKRERGNETSSWDQPESGTRRSEEDVRSRAEDAE